MPLTYFRWSLSFSLMSLVSLTRFSLTQCFAKSSHFSVFLSSPLLLVSELLTGWRSLTAYIFVLQCVLLPLNWVLPCGLGQFLVATEPRSSSSHESCGGGNVQAVVSHEKYVSKRNVWMIVKSRADLSFSTRSYESIKSPQREAV